VFCDDVDWRGWASLSTDLSLWCGATLQAAKMAARSARFGVVDQVTDKADKADKLKARQDRFGGSPKKGPKKVVVGVS
jgi:hypothetical protein